MPGFRFLRIRIRIRTQLLWSAAVAALVTLAVVVALVHVTQQAQHGLDEQLESQDVVRHVANMLALTNEFAVHGGPRVAAQWRSRHAQLQASVAGALQRHQPPEPALVELQSNIADLPMLFDKLVGIDIDRDADRTPSDLVRKRRELLLERLLAETQEVVESRHRWATAIGVAQQHNQQLYTAIVLAAPAALLLLLLSLGLLISRRVLLPAGRLQAAATAIQRGDLGARCASDAADELGDAARAVDAMALALQQQTLALKASEHRLRLITDSLPALVGHVDAEQRYTFVNAHYRRTGIGDPDAMVGRTMLQERGPEIHAALAPHIARALAGDTVSFETTRLFGDRTVHRQSTYVPDVDEAGTVHGFYAMTFDITERKEAELRQAASERLLVDITDNLPALVAYIGSDKRYRFANSRYQEWLGVDHRALIGRHVGDAIGLTSFGPVREKGEQALAGQRVRWERHVVRHERDFHYLADLIPDIDADGKVCGVYALTIDITERRMAELALKRSEQQMADLINNIPALVGYFDMDERCHYANDTALRTQGLTRADIPGITLRAALGESNYAQHEPYVRQALAGRRSRLEGRIPFVGRDAHFQAHLIPDRVDGGGQRGFYLMTFDITALKEAQQKQERVERQLRAITDNLPVLISYVDRDERYLFVNATVKEWVGAEPQALVGRTMAESMTEANYAQRREHIDAALAGGRVEFEIESTALGRTRNLHSVYIPDIQSDGRVVGVYTLTTDVTALKDAERRMSRLARVDTLTDLPNRRQFDERLAEAIARSARSGKPLALMFLDIDHFKAINDTWGHATGDAVLKEFAARLRKSVRLTDMPARLAGDEFVVLLEGLHGEADATVVAEKLVANVRKPFIVDGNALRVTTSVGIAYAERPTPDSGLVELADEALYRAKGAGRDTFRLSTVAVLA